jgi:hypothetical protein
MRRLHLRESIERNQLVETADANGTRDLTRLSNPGGIIARDNVKNCARAAAGLFFFSRSVELAVQPRTIATAAGSRRKGSPHTDAKQTWIWTAPRVARVCKLVASEIRGWCGTDSVGTPSGQSQLPRAPRIYSRDENPRTIISWTMDIRTSRSIFVEKTFPLTMRIFCQGAYMSYLSVAIRRFNGCLWGTYQWKDFFMRGLF